jgi:SAM-dependent methyltransferase
MKAAQGKVNPAHRMAPIMKFKDILQGKNGRPGTPDVDTPESSALHAEAIRSKSFLRKIYLENYQYFKSCIEETPAGTVLEVGSGGGFLKDVIPAVITSDVMKVSNVELYLSAMQLPFADESLRAILMMDVFHHMQDVSKFLNEAQRCLKAGGKVVLIEPANTLWGRTIYKNFHHEPFIPDQQEWQLPVGGPMSQANGALPWIVFMRDIHRFERDYPQLRVEQIEFTCPIRYLASGGVSLPQLVPSFSYPAFKTLEWLMTPFMAFLGMFMRIEIVKSDK